MSRMSRRSSYTAIAFAGFAAILLALPVKAHKTATPQIMDASPLALQQDEDAPIVLIHYYERADITPNEEVAGVVIRHEETTIWEDDFVLRPEET